MSRVTKFEQRLRAAFERNVGKEAVDTALAIIARKVHPRTVPAAEQWERQCYNRPSLHELTMCALDSLLGTHGVECIGDVDMHDGPPVEYLNTGDSYAHTVVWYRDRKTEWRVEGWADAAERLGL
jgi:hypothetical protein